MSTRIASNAGRLGFALGNALVALAVGVGVFAGLPQRWWVVDVPAGLGVALLIASVYGLLRPEGIGRTLARAGALYCLAAGAALFAALCLAAAYAWGIHGVLGRGVAIAYAVIIVPTALWLVLYPAGQLLWLHRALQPDQES